MKTEPVASVAANADVYYISAKHPSFAFTLYLNKTRKRFKCVKGRVQVIGEWADELDRLLALPSDQCALNMYLTKVDKAAADRWLKQQLAADRGRAVKGPMTSDAMTGLQMKADAALADPRSQVADEVKEQIADDLGVAKVERVPLSRLVTTK